MLRFIVLLLVLGIVVQARTPSALAAEEEAQLDERTQELVQRGIALRRAGDDESALSVFLEAEKHSPQSVRVLLHITTAAQATGRWPLAYQYLQRASRFRNDPYYIRYRSSIRAIEETLAQHVGLFRVIGTPNAAEVVINGLVIGTVPMNEPRVLETGTYSLEVRKFGYFPLRRPLTIAPGAALSQEAVELSENTGSQALPPHDTREPLLMQKVSHLPPAETSDSVWRSTWLTWTLGATSAALVTASAISFGIREQKANQWNDEQRCLDPSNAYLTREQVCGGIRDSAKSAERIGIVTGALGVGFGAATLAQWFWGSRLPSGESNRKTARASCAAGLDRVVCEGVF